MAATRIAFASLVTVAGFAIFIGTERALRGALFLMENEVFVAPAFSGAVWGVALLGLFFVAFGIAAVGPNSPSREKLFVYAEGPLAIPVASFVVFRINTFRMIGDVGPVSAVDLSAPVPLPLLMFVRPLVFYLVVAGLVAGTVFLLMRQLRRPVA
jgi:hypothetical protein